MGIRFGCHGYTWQMSYETYKDDLPHILDVIARNGFKSLDTQVRMLGSFYEDPSALKEELERRGLELAALTLPLYWRFPEETEDERREADYFIDYLSQFPNALMNIVPIPPVEHRGDLRQRQSNILSCVNSLSRRAAEKGIVCAFHPNSSPGSVFQTAEDYKVMFDGLDTRVLGYTPDAGHIVKGGIDVIDIFASYGSIIKHVHFKDISADKQWKAMGEGIIDFPAIIGLLNKADYNGWIMVEEESAEAEADPDAAMVGNGIYVKEKLAPLTLDMEVEEIE